MKIRLNKAHFPVTVLGPGRRIGLWLQGCSIGCVGCCSRDTWDADSGRYISVATLVSWCKQVGAEGVDGITVSGGEPFEQPEALNELLVKLREWRRDAGLDFDILVYSGYAFSQLERRFASTVTLADVVVPGPYVASRPSEMGLTGSTNQKLHFLNDDVQRRYIQWLDDQQNGNPRRIQLAVDDAGVWLVGIPRAGDLTKLEAMCRDAGLELAGSSWRA